MYYLLLSVLAIVIITVTYGITEAHKQDINLKKKVKKAMVINLSTFIPVICAAIIMMVPDFASAAAVTDAAANSSAGIGYIAAALSTGLAAIGAGYAVGTVGSSALGAVSEDPSILGKTLIYVGLSEGIAIYGLIISIMILSKL
ncbi:MAG TPA: ATP synthase subunit C [Clostridiaceae bacterium]